MDNKNMDKVSKLAEDTVSKMKQEISDDEINQNLNNIPIKNEFVRKNSMALCAALSLIFCLFPFLKIGAEAEGNTTVDSFNIFQLLSGDNGSIFTILMLLLPVLLIVMNYIKALHPYRRAIAITVPVANFLFEIILFFILKAGAKAGGAAGSSMASEYGVSIKTICSPHIGFFLLLLSYILTAVVGCITYYGLKLPDKINKK